VASPPLASAVPSPLDQLREVVNAVKIPVQAVGGLSLEQAIASARNTERRSSCSERRSRLMPTPSRLADGNLEASLRLICDAIHAQDVPAF